MLDEKWKLPESRSRREEMRTAQGRTRWAIWRHMRKRIHTKGTKEP